MMQNKIVCLFVECHFSCLLTGDQKTVASNWMTNIRPKSETKIPHKCQQKKLI